MVESTAQVFDIMRSIAKVNQLRSTTHVFKYSKHELLRK